LADEEDEPWMEQLPLPSLPELNDGYEAGHEEQAPQVTLDFYPEIFNTTAFSATYRKHESSSKYMYDHSLGAPSNIQNWLLDSGASSHMTTSLTDLEKLIEEVHKVVEVADGHMIISKNHVVSHWTCMTITGLTSRQQ
jgi:hypothetical protein